MSRPMFTIYKCLHDGSEKVHYSGALLARGDHWIQLEARFQEPDYRAHYTTLRHHDRFIELFYTDRGYNIFENHDVDDDHLKGWYCNITRPAVISADSVRWEDLALDLWVAANGDMLTLDEDEFEALPIDAETRQYALDALAALRQRVERRESPFDVIGK